MNMLAIVSQELEAINTYNLAAASFASAIV